MPQNGSQAPDPADSINMARLCQTLARVLVFLEKSQYTEDIHQTQQVAVRQHDDSPTPTSEATLSEDDRIVP